MASSSSPIGPSLPSLGSASAATDSADLPPLVKPELPTVPPAPDLRHVKDEAVKAARLQQHAAKLGEYAQAKKHYDDVLYPGYRKEQKRRGAARARESHTVPRKAAKRELANRIFELYEKGLCECSDEERRMALAQSVGLDAEDVGLSTEACRGEA